jgi:hypothetical protein
MVKKAAMSAFILCLFVSSQVWSGCAAPPQNSYGLCDVVFDILLSPCSILSEIGGQGRPHYGPQQGPGLVCVPQKPCCGKPKKPKSVGGRPSSPAPQPPAVIPRQGRGVPEKPAGATTPEKPARVTTPEKPSKVATPEKPAKMAPPKQSKPGPTPGPVESPLRGSSANGGQPAAPPPDVRPPTERPTPFPPGPAPYAAPSRQSPGMERPVPPAPRVQEPWTERPAPPTPGLQAPTLPPQAIEPTPKKPVPEKLQAPPKPPEPKVAPVKPTPKPVPDNEGSGCGNYYPSTGCYPPPVCR